MTSSAGQTALPIDQLPNSEPESLDSLDYDDWEGQFEFFGCNSASNPSNTQPTNNGDGDDLNLTAPSSYTQSLYANKRPILIDEETFLSLQSIDGTAIDYGLDHLAPAFQAPQAHIIETALKHLQFDKTATAVPSAMHATDHPATIAGDSSHFDRILRLKNRLNNTKSNAMMQPSDSNNNHSRNNNDNKHTNRNSQSRLSECHSFLWNDDGDKGDDGDDGDDDGDNDDGADRMHIKLNGRHYSNDLCDTFLKEQVSSVVAVINRVNFSFGCCFFWLISPDTIENSGSAEKNSSMMSDLTDVYLGFFRNYLDCDFSSKSLFRKNV